MEVRLDRNELVEAISDYAKRKVSADLAVVGVRLREKGTEAVVDFAPAETVEAVAEALETK